MHPSESVWDGCGTFKRGRALLEEVGHCRQTLWFCSRDFLLLDHSVLPDYVSNESSCLVGLLMKLQHRNCLDCSAHRTPVKFSPLVQSQNCP